MDIINIMKRTVTMFTKYARLLLFLLIIVLVFVSCDTQKQSLDESKKDLKEKLKVHFIDIGQGDSILIEQDTYTMLIDTGPKESEKILMDYLASQNIKKIDYLVLTHQHRDHIGNAAMIIKTLKSKPFIYLTLQAIPPDLRI